MEQLDKLKQTLNLYASLVGSSPMGFIILNLISALQHYITTACDASSTISPAQVSITTADVILLHTIAVSLKEHLSKQVACGVLPENSTLNVERLLMHATQQPPNDARVIYVRAIRDALSLLKTFTKLEYPDIEE